MPYKTIILSLLEQHPVIYQALKSNGTLLTALDSYAQTLQERHDYWAAQLSGKQPQGSAQTLRSQAMELAIRDVRESLPTEAEETEPVDLDAAMSYLRRHTPPAS